LRGKADNYHPVTLFVGRVDIPTPDHAVDVVDESPAITSSIHILIADDHPTILQMVKQILTAQPGFEVVGEARDGLEAVTLAEALKPDLIEEGPVRGRAILLLPASSDARLVRSLYSPIGKFTAAVCPQT
jgi:hypothetical protein